MYLIWFTTTYLSLVNESWKNATKMHALCLKKEKFYEKKRCCKEKSQKDQEKARAVLRKSACGKEGVLKYDQEDHDKEGAVSRKSHRDKKIDAVKRRARKGTRVYAGFKKNNDFFEKLWQQQPIEPEPDVHASKFSTSFPNEQNIIRRASCLLCQ